MVRWSFVFGLLGASIGLLAEGALAQSVIVPDETLGVERSVVTPLDADGFPVERITGGAQRGINLFHSFREFNVGEGRGAYFAVPNTEIQNVLARVIGPNRSEILGTLGLFNELETFSQSNLFLINPNGIIFGSNAALDVSGSFIATTANAVQFGDQGVFNAINSESPGLLSINPSSLLFNQLSRPGDIVVRSAEGIPVLGDFINPRFQPINILPNQVIPNFPGLQVGDQKTLALIGGDITLSNSALSVDGGRIELGSIHGSGEVSLTPVSDGFTLGYEKISNFGDIKWESSFINANGLGGGNIQIQAASLLTTPDNFFSGISAQTQGNKNGGEILIRADKAIQMDNAAITATVAPNVRGNGNKITIKTPSLKRNGEDSSILTRNFGNNNKAGDILVQAQEITLTDGSAILTSARGTGSAGNLTIKASKFIDVSGTNTSSEEETVEGLQADVTGTGAGGIVLIETPRLVVRDGAIISARTNNGSGGKIIINAPESVELQSKGSIRAQTFGSGNAGSITIETKKLKTSSGSEITASASFRSRGNAGNIIVNATESVELIGVGGIISAVIGGNGAGGNLSIDTKKLSLIDGGTISSEAITRTRGGNIFISADLIEVNGYDPGGFIPSQITTRTSSLSKEPSGNITIIVRRLNIQDGGQIKVDTLGSNPAGNLIINASESINLAGTSQPNLFEERQPSALSATTRESQGGTIRLTTPQFNILNGAEVNFSSRGQAKAGNLEVEANIVRLYNNARIIGTSVSGNGGNIDFQVKDLMLLRHGSQISTTAGTSQTFGDGGNIKISGGFIVAIQKENSDITANAFSGTGGQIIVNSPGIFGLRFRPKVTDFSDITASSSFGANGIVILNSPDNTSIQNSLNQLPNNQIDTNKLLAQTCLIRQDQPEGTFYITGTGSLPNRPNDPALSDYPTNTVQPTTQTAQRPWKLGDPIIEPQGFYKLADGRFVMSRECSQ
jgi:filamentous hemagglutinin family protein